MLGCCPIGIKAFFERRAQIKPIRIQANSMSQDTTVIKHIINQGKQQITGLGGM